METVAKYKTSGKQSKRLQRSITFGFLLVAILTWLAFAAWVGMSFNYRLNQLYDNLVSNWNDVYDIIEPTLFIDGDIDKKKGPLIPIQLKRLPSPFSSSRINYYKNEYLYERHSYGSDVANKVDLLIGYSNVELRKGRLGSKYLSAIIWFEDDDLILDNISTSTGRDSGDHFWFVYHDKNNNTGSFLLSLQGAVGERAGSNKVAEVSGFIAKEFGSTLNLKREPTIRGSVFKDLIKNKYILVFRVMVPNKKSKSRKSIDVNKEVGFRYINRHKVDGTADILSTFKYVGKKIHSIINHPKKSTVERLANIDDKITGIQLINPKDDDKTYITLLDRKGLYNEQPKITYKGILKKLLTEVAKLRFNNNLIGENNELYYDGPDQINLSKEQSRMLRLTSNIYQEVPPFIEDIKPTIYLFIIVTVILFFTYLYVFLYVVRRVVKLASSLDKYKNNPDGVFDDLSLSSSDEIGSLAKTLSKLFYEIHGQNKIITESKKQAEERYKLHTEMTKIYGHDIRTPIAALLSLFESQKIPRKYIKQIQRATETIMEAVEFEESLATRLNISDMDLVEFGRAISDGAANLKIADQDIKFITSSTTISVAGDEEYLEDSIDCIINNACDFGRNVRVSTRKDSTHGIIEIFDEGDEIDDDKIDAIFEYGTSFREDSSEHHHGIGLFSAKLRINVMGGTIAAFNNGGGVTFIVKLPLANIQNQ